MFNINENKAFHSVIPDIVDNYEVLHFDEYPILYIGTNIDGNRIIGSLIWEDEESDIFYYFHSQVSSAIFNRFIYKKISYRELLFNATAIFVLKKDINNKILSRYNLSFQEIPSDYLPLPTAYCPTTNFKFGFEFSVSLKGKLADIHEAMIESVYSVTNYTASLIKEAVSSLYALKLKAQIHQLPNTIGSFKINLKVDIPNYVNMFISKDEIADYVNKYLKYCIDDLSDEINNSKNITIENEKKFEALSIIVQTMYDKGGAKFNREALAQHIMGNMPKIERLVEEVGNGFKEIEILSKTQNNNTEMPIAFIDSYKKDKIEKIAEYVLLNSNDIKKDDEDKEYKICIYHLNTDSRKGNAYIYSDEEKTIMDKPLITISGKDDLSRSIYTESLHLNKWITIKGKAQRKNNIFTKIVINGE